MTQAEALNILKLGHNVFLTGAAGAGKTYLLNQYIDYLKEFGVGVAITASTGIAATHLNGQTIHSFAGFGIRESVSDKELKELAAKDKVKRNFQKTDVLVIDEVSMLHPYQLDIVDSLAREIRDPFQPFGGIQIVLCGDFFQLPPVSRKKLDASAPQFAYESTAWKNADFKICYLTQQHRQQNDPLLDVLNAIRRGEKGEPAKAPLRLRYRRDPAISGQATRLFVRNVNVDALNAKELDKFVSEPKVFKMRQTGISKLAEALKKNCLAQEELVLKVGAEVMFIQNAQDNEYVNGTRGRVIGFDDYSDLPIVKTNTGKTIIARESEWALEENGTVRAKLIQIPLRLAWAITIHKSQGMTLDSAEIDLSDAFEPGMGYVALSRVRTLDGIKLMGLNEVALSVNPKILSFDNELRSFSGKAVEGLANLSVKEIEEAQQATLTQRFKGSAEKGKELKQRSEEVKTPTHEQTLKLVEKKKPLKQIAKQRGLTQPTIISHLEKLKSLGKLPDVLYLMPPTKERNVILAELAKPNDGKLTPIFKKLKGKYDFDTLRLVRLLVEN